MAAAATAAAAASAAPSAPHPPPAATAPGAQQGGESPSFAALLRRAASVRPPPGSKGARRIGCIAYLRGTCTRVGCRFVHSRTQCVCEDAACPHFHWDATPQRDASHTATPATQQDLALAAFYASPFTAVHGSASPQSLAALSQLDAAYHIAICPVCRKIFRAQPSVAASAPLFATNAAARATYFERYTDDLKRTKQEELEAFELTAAPASPPTQPFASDFADHVKQCVEAFRAELMRIKYELAVLAIEAHTAQVDVYAREAAAEQRAILLRAAAAGGARRQRTPTSAARRQPSPAGPDAATQGAPRGPKKRRGAPRSRGGGHGPPPRCVARRRSQRARQSQRATALRDRPRSRGGRPRPRLPPLPRQPPRRPRPRRPQRAVTLRSR